MNVFYSTTDGERTGRASHFYKNESDAITIVAEQSAKAIEMGLKTLYGLASCDDSDLPSNDKVR